MVYAGQIVTDASGKPQIVESVNGNSYVTREAQPSELMNRALPSTIAPEYNPNLPQNQNVAPAPAKEVEVLGGLPSAQDEASMYAEGYEYAGQKNNMQTWVRVTKPKAPGTYTSVGGGTWEVEDITQTIMENGEAVATFGGQNVYYSTKPVPSNEGQLPKEQTITAGKPNPFNPSFQNPFNPNEIITTMYSDGTERGLLERANLNIRYDSLSGFEKATMPLVVAGSPYGFEYAGEYLTTFGNETARSDYIKSRYFSLKDKLKADNFGLANEYFAISPGGVALQGAITGGVFTGLASLAKGSVVGTGILKGAGIGFTAIYGTEKAIEGYSKFQQKGLAGAIETGAEVTTFMAGAKAGEYLYKSDIGTELRQRAKDSILKTEIKIQQPDTKIAVTEPNANKSGFVVESESYAVRTRTLVGTFKFRDIVDVTKAKSYGTIERAGDVSMIEGKTEYYNLNPATDVETIEVSDVIGSAKTNVINENVGLKRTLDKIKVAEDLKTKQTAGFFNVLNSEKSIRVNRYGNKEILSESSTRGFIIEATRQKGKVSAKSMPFDESSMLKTTQIRMEGFKEIDASIESINPKEPEFKYLDESQFQKGYKISDELSGKPKRNNGFKYDTGLKGKIPEVKGKIFEAKDILKRDTDVEIKIDAKPKGSMSTTSVSLISSIGKIAKGRASYLQNERINPLEPGSPSIRASGYNFADLIKVPKDSNTERISTTAGSTLNKASIGNPTKPGNTEASREKIEMNIGLGTGNATGQGQSNILSESLIQSTGQETPVTQITKTINIRPRPHIVRNVDIKIFPNLPKIKKYGSDWKPKVDNFKFKLPKERLAYRKKDELKVSPIQADVSKWYYGKVTNPKPTRALLSRATISVPSAEQIRHKSRG